jgi:hypothetical protein
MRDEKDARQQLITLWPTSSASVRKECEGEATTGGSQSYVDLLTCMQITSEANALSSASAAPLRGASKNRNKK